MPEIISKGETRRVELLTGSRKRLSLPLLKWATDAVILVEPNELEAYRSAHPSQTIEPLPKNDGGFSYLMNQMVSRTIRLGRRYFVFTDDDVTDMRHRPSMADKFAACRGETLRTQLDLLVGWAGKADLAQYAVSFAGQSWGAKDSTQHGVGAWGVHVTDARAVRAVGGYDESLVCFGDWDISARLLAAGYRTARTNLLSFVHKMKSHEGGAAEIYSRKETVRDAAERVAAKFPGVARVVYVESHGLHEVRFNWRKLQAQNHGKLTP